jgi:hypothetical protein
MQARANLVVTFLTILYNQPLPRMSLHPGLAYVGKAVSRYSRSFSVSVKIVTIESSACCEMSWPTQVAGPLTPFVFGEIKPIDR